MRVCSLTQIGTEEWTARHIIVLPQNWRTVPSYSYLKEPRPDSGLLFVKSGEIRETLPDGTAFTAKAGDLVSLPTGSYYRAEFSDEQPTVDQLINFRLYDRTGEEILLTERPMCLRPLDQTQCAMLFDRALAAFSTARGHLRLAACLFELLDEIRLVYTDFAVDERFARIRPALERLENSVTENTDTKELADICGISESTLRRCFHQSLGVSPIEYRNRLRISLAKRLLSARELTVQEISTQLGFYDSAYFCRVFKEKTGRKPSDYAAPKAKP